MNVSINPPGPQLYVDISSLAAHLASANSVEDVHICGVCKRNFSDIEHFVEHKRAGCSSSPQKAVSSSVVPSHNASPLGFETNNASSNNDDNISSLGPQYLRVIFEGENLIDEDQTVDQQLSDALPCSSSTESDILRNRLLGLAKPVSSEANHSFSSSNDLHTLVLDDQQPNAKAREFHLDEEDVATLLANQLASEVVNTGDVSKSVSGLIDISSNLQTKTNEHFVGLQSVNISIGSAEPRAKDDANKRMEKKICVPTRQLSSGNMGESSEWIDESGNNGNKINTSLPVCSPVATGPNVVSSSKICINDLKETSVVLPDGPNGKKKYKCNHDSCDFTTLYLKDLVRHVRKHTGEKPFTCFSCYRTFSRLDKLHVHERIHTGEKKYQCTVCQYATRDSGSLRKHMRVHNDERPYKCQMCSYRSRDSSQLTVHLRTHTGDHPFVCPFEDCSSAFKTSSDLKRHSRTHTGEKPFVCSRCDYKSAIKSNLSFHMRHNHSEFKTFSCNTCKLVCSTKRELKDHEKTHAEILKCGLCSFTCVGITSMKNHLRVYCGDKALSCILCSFTCQFAGNLRTHMKKKHPDVSRKKTRGSSKESSDKNHTGRSGNKSNVHLKPSCVKSYKCTYCEEAYVREDSWRSHMRQHKNTSGKLAVPASTTKLPSTAVTSASVETAEKSLENTATETTCNVEVTSQSQKEAESSASNFLGINYDESSLKGDENTLSGQIDKVINDNVVATSEIDSSFVQYSVGDKNDKGEIQIVHQVNSEVLDRDNLSSQPILFYVQNAPVLHGGLDSSLRNAEILASINPSPPILVSRCGQYVSVPLEQGGSLVEPFTSSSLPQGMQYIVSAPFEGVVGSNTAFLQPVDSAETSGNPVSVVSFQLDKSSSVPVSESRN